MTNFFGINITKGQESDNMDGAPFLTRTIPAALEEEIAAFSSKSDEFEKKLALPMPLGILKILCQIGWLVILAGLLRADVGFAEGYRNVPWLYWAGALCFAVWLFLFIYGRIRERRVGTDASFGEHIDNADALLRKSMRALHIPETADSIDILAERYILKDGEPKHRDFGLTGYANLDLYIFTENGCLCLADPHQVWEIPLDSLRSVTLQKKRVSFPDWHKDEPANSPKYKPFKITTNNYGHYFARCYRVEIRDMRGEFYLLIPEYDGEAFLHLTHLRPAE